MPGISFEPLFKAYQTLSSAYWAEVSGNVFSGALDGQAVRLESWRRTIVACGSDDESLAALALEAYSRHRRESYSLFEDARSVLEVFAGRLPLALITNGSSDTQWEKARSLGLDASFKAIVVSADVGAARPDPAIFRLALDALQVEPAAVWHIGDSLESDVAGAKAAGITAVWLNRAGRKPDGGPVPDHEIASLAELPALLEAHGTR